MAAKAISWDRAATDPIVTAIGELASSDLALPAALMMVALDEAYAFNTEVSRDVIERTLVDVVRRYDIGEIVLF